MTRLIASFLFLTLTALPVLAAEPPPLGAFKVVNTTGFSEEDGHRRPIARDRRIGQATISQQTEDSLQLAINGTKITLFALPKGLDGLEWTARDAEILHHSDIAALNSALADSSLPAWGAEVAWPGAGLARLVLMPVGPEAYTGFLISYPGGKIIVRQMEFRQVFGPADRPSAGTFEQEQGF